MADEALHPSRSEVVVDFDKEDDLLTLTSEAFVLQVRASAEDLVRLDRAPTAEWSRRQSIAVGTTGMGRVYWCAGEAPDTGLVLVGHDDEAWNLALAISVATVQTIVRLAAEIQGA
jgi:hypothetical protein